ncbi:MAG: N-acetylmuramoyl-L-alanine amidase [Lachnospiraceae bacterium]|nr:N-acetylmuramoyl-L-alanine amidase [Lachnospiraceae bacterium]
MPSIILDPGHGGWDNGAQYAGRREKDDNLALALEVGARLTEDGYDVIYTRTEDVYDSPGQKARIANASGGDLFISFHRNSSPNPNTYSGVETLVFEDEGLVGELSRNINWQLEGVGFQNLGVRERRDLTVLRRTQMPAVLIETGFLNTDADNDLFEGQFSQIADAIAEGIEQTIEEREDRFDGDYSVQVGLYSSFERAQYALMDAVEKGYEGEVVPWKNYFAVRLGDFDTLGQAESFAAELRANGYETLVVLDR